MTPSLPLSRSTLAISAMAMAIRSAEDETGAAGGISGSANDLAALFHGRDHISGQICGGKAVNSCAVRWRSAIAAR